MGRRERESELAEEGSGGEEGGGGGREGGAEGEEEGSGGEASEEKARLGILILRNCNFIKFFII